MTALEAVVLPSSDADGLRAPGLRFGDPRVMALLAALAAFSHVVGGLTNPGLCRLVGDLLGKPYTRRQATYDLRRLRRKGLVERVPGRNLYRVTPHGRAVATFLTKVAARIVVPGLTELKRRRHLAPPLLDLSSRRGGPGSATRCLHQGRRHRVLKLDSSVAKLATKKT